MRSSLWVVTAVLFGVCTAHAADTTVATVGSKKISQAELDKHVQARLFAIEQERYQALREGLDELVAKELFEQEAKARGITVEALVKTEIEDKVTEPAEADLKELYEANKEDLGNESMESVRPRLVAFLRQMQEQKAHEALVTQLKGKYKTSIALRPPVVEVGTGARPSRGNPKAQVKIVEFSDYECPYCKKGEEAIAQVMKEYGDRVQLYYRDFPLPFHKNARNAALAANCASAQGKFWEYHGKLFAIDQLSPEKMKATAGELGLDQAKFNTCFDNQEFKAAVDKDMQDGQKVGVTGTPTFFVNGRVLSGAQPFEAFKEVIEEELARARGSNS